MEKGIRLPTGLYSSTLADCWIGDGALVSGTGLLAACVVCEGVIVMNCGTVSCGGDTKFGNGMELALAIENGGRETAVFADATLACLAEICGNRSDPARLAAYRQAVARYAEAASSRVTILEAGSRLRQCPRVTDAFVGVAAVVEAATLQRCTLLSQPGVRGPGHCVQLCVH